mmetsp:Transcript_21676/g.50680  ORF Transcript_21676/g.50680 Transcript_21676/m.50680 type:complete len:568 (+) Transcript_21676:114-1817(+)|eukprot:CAMPEP_0178427966 /NCGR_PEP_ID=MMETSP0689_2-20121128/30025_1 /TAXON_ID=160604 /ORGANISM="Amphidinium massartii, Strain CS-259" /LENGTH=567 /DNA_ID=CAMNT_0020049705 /DNA_START=46 /DNA_END=1749 /DNA_ORIENTATION=-
MTCEVSFKVKCVDTRIGLHVRVVGSVKTLGSWSPPAGLVLHTSASDFPLWTVTAPVQLDEDAVIEYKYVICDNEGRPSRWEERPNRSLRLSNLGGRSSGGGLVYVLEVFNAETTPDSERFFQAQGSSMAPMQSMKLARQGSVKEGHQGEQPNDGLFAPTRRERTPSQGLLARGSSHSLLPPQGATPLGVVAAGSTETPAPEESPEPAAPAKEPSQPSQPSQESQTSPPGPPPPAPASGGGAAGPADLNLVREESSSNLFYNQEEEPVEENPEEQPFESQYTMVGHGPLGEGTFGLVWRCVLKKPAANGNEAAPEEYAAKIVRKARLKPRDMKHLLGQDGEIDTHKKMMHPHIVRLYESYEDEKTVKLVLEYCRGGDLFDAIVRNSKARDKGGLVESASALVMSHILDALEYMHKQNIVHRDIKCENILLAYKDVPIEENVFKLCDFGFAAKDLGQGLSDRLGSPDTVAPEVVDGRNYSTPADMWSAGVLLYMMISATPPFWAPKDSEVLMRVRNGAYSMSGEIWDNISPPCKGLLASLLTKEAQNRPTAAKARRDEWMTVSGFAPRG